MGEEEAGDGDRDEDRGEGISQDSKVYACVVPGLARSRWEAIQGLARRVWFVLAASAVEELVLARCVRSHLSIISLAFTFSRPS